MNLTIPQELQNEYPFSGYYFNTKKGHRLHYLDEGCGHPIIMVHGNPTWSFFYRNLIKKLRGQFRIIVVDHLGMGLSDRPQNHDYTLENHIQNLTDLLASLKIGEASLVVHDWGGPIGLGLALKSKLKLKKTVIMNTAAFTDSFIPKSIQFCRTPGIGDFMMRGFNAFAWPATFMAVERPLEKIIKKGYLHPYSNYRNRIGVARFVQDIPMENKHPSYNTLKEIESKLPELPGEKLLLWGAKDFCFTPHFFDRFKDIFPTAKTKLIADAGHYLLEDSQLALDTIESYFKE